MKTKIDRAFDRTKATQVISLADEAKTRSMHHAGDVESLLLNGTHVLDNALGTMLYAANKRSESRPDRRIQVVDEVITDPVKCDVINNKMIPLLKKRPSSVKVGDIV